MYGVLLSYNVIERCICSNLLYLFYVYLNIHLYYTLFDVAVYLEKENEQLNIFTIL